MKKRAILLLAAVSIPFLPGCASQHHQTQVPPAPTAPQKPVSEAKVYSQKRVPGKDLTNEEIARLMNPSTPVAEKQRLIRKAPHIEGYTSGLGGER